MIAFKAVAQGFLKFVLWTAFVISLVWTVAAPWAADQERVAASRAGIAARPGPADLPSPSSLFVLIPAAGFLAIIGILERAAEDILLAIQSSPNATAQAMRRAVRPTPTAE